MPSDEREPRREIRCNIPEEYQYDAELNARAEQEDAPSPPVPSAAPTIAERTRDGDLHPANYLGAAPAGQGEQPPLNLRDTAIQYTEQRPPNWSDKFYKVNEVRGMLADFAGHMIEAARSAPSPAPRCPNCEHLVSEHEPQASARYGGCTKQIQVPPVNEERYCPCTLSREECRTFVLAPE